jgi:phosphoribosylformimino-5-aminoimidazole carboxamide ribotide isomerase
MMPFHIYPAIDIQGGRCVRLVQGDFKRSTTYFNDPLEAARHWRSQGAGRLHVVDLDGAREGRPLNRDMVMRMAEEIDIPVQCGGGLREYKDIEYYLEGGVRWVVLGTKALEDAELLKKALQRYGSRVVVGLDLRGGRAAVEGWTRDCAADLKEMLGGWSKLGVRRIVFTDISRDGTLRGYAASDILLEVAKAGFEVIASGGVTTTDDLMALKRLSPRGVVGAIVGKALYDGSMALRDALRLEED